jgi:predicted  nucleic acid-binding Zn-ribbon protein
MDDLNILKNKIKSLEIITNNLLQKVHNLSKENKSLKSKILKLNDEIYRIKNKRN